MASLAQLQQDVFDFRGGKFVCVTKVSVTSGSDTLVVPEGLQHARHVVVVPVDPSDTAKTVSSISQSAHPGGATITMTGGTNGSEQLVISLHIGNPAGL